MIPPASAEITSDARLPEREVLYQAEKKAASLAAAFPGTVVIGSDTLINLDGQKIGKPHDAPSEQTLVRGAQPPIPPAPARWVTDTAGFMSAEAAHSLDAQLEAYVSSGDPFDKAGGYSLQGGGRELVAGLTGD